MSETLSLAKSLINIESVTPHDNGCQKIITDLLRNLGFKVKDLSSNGVSNLWAHRGDAKPMFVFAGHTDVVPPGEIKKWHTDPFQATVKNDLLYGRGAADMKSAIAAMLVACQHFIKKHPQHKGAIGFMITSDEEGQATDGTVKIVDYVKQHKIGVDYCLVGEASSQKALGDAVKVGRRGSLHGNLQVIGKQGHIAYPKQADNPIHRCFKALDALTNTEWDQGNEYFPPTSFQIYNIMADTGATNIIPGSLTAKFNFRFCPVSTAEQLQKKVQQVFEDHGLQYKIDWNLSSKPFLSKDGKLLTATKDAIESICGIETNPNTSGGTSDGRFISTTGCEIIELGAVSSCIHQVNEHINIHDLNKLTELYEDILTRLLT